MTTRRHDPQRRDRIVDATLDLIADAGVAGVSHRRVAERADVPLGSMTYHFDGMDDLLHVAFTRFAARVAETFADHFEGVETQQAAIDAVLRLIGDLSDEAAHRDVVISYELYTLAARDPRYRGITTRWMESSREALGRVFDPGVTPQLDALIEGFALYRALALTPPDPAIVEDAVRRLVAG